MGLVGLAGLPGQRDGSAAWLGAALTYARRYALFTLVGIAGEDDLDAPDLSPADGINGPLKYREDPGALPNPAPLLAAGRPLPASERRARSERPGPPTLSRDASDDLRRRLTSELEQLETSEALVGWAQRALPLKNQLSTADAQAVEDAFTARLSQLEESEPRAARHQEVNSPRNQPLQVDPGEQAVTVISKPVRERDREHLKFVASRPCLICGRTPSDAHHIKFAEQRAMGRVSDRFTVPICRLHHRELHRRGNERAWWENQGIDPLVIAATLWRKTHELEPAAANIAGDPPTTINGTLNGRHYGNGAAAAGRPQNDETKPILRPEGQNDVRPPNRGQPPKRTAQHRAGDRRGQEEVAAKCRSPRADGRNRDRRAGRRRGLCGF